MCYKYANSLSHRILAGIEMKSKRQMKDVDGKSKARTAAVIAQDLLVQRLHRIPHLTPRKWWQKIYSPHCHHAPSSEHNKFTWSSPSLIR